VGVRSARGAGELDCSCGCGAELGGCGESSLRTVPGVRAARLADFVEGGAACREFPGRRLRGG